MPQMVPLAHVGGLLLIFGRARKRGTKSIWKVCHRKYVDCRKLYFRTAPVLMLQHVVGAKTVSRVKRISWKRASRTFVILNLPCNVSFGLIEISQIFIYFVLHALRQFGKRSILILYDMTSYIASYIYY